MKKLIFILFVFIFASSASAAIYKWVDERGVVNYADDYSKVPPDYRNKVEEVNITRMGPSYLFPHPTWKHVSWCTVREYGNTGASHCAVSYREGDFAIKTWLRHLR